MQDYIPAKINPEKNFKRMKIKRIIGFKKTFKRRGGINE